MAEWLRAEFIRQERLTGKHFGPRTLAHRMNPERPENMRRLIHKWLNGKNATEESIQRVADALDIPREQIPVRGDGRSAAPFTPEVERALELMFRRWLDREVYGNGPRRQKVRV